MLAYLARDTGNRPAVGCPPLPPVKYAQAQDAGDGYDYGHGAHSVILVNRSESIRTLRIGQHEGTYPGMPASIEMKIASVSAGHGTGLESTDTPDKLVDYAGRQHRFMRHNIDA